MTAVMKWPDLFCVLRPPKDPIAPGRNAMLLRCVVFGRAAVVLEGRRKGDGGLLKMAETERPVQLLFTQELVVQE